MIRLILKYRLAIAFAVTLALLLFNGVLSWWKINRLIETNERVDNSYKVLAQLAEFGSALGEAESGQRGYLLTGRAHYLEHHQEALLRIHNGLERLNRFTADNPHQQERLRLLAPAIENYQKLCEPITRLEPSDPGFSKTDSLTRCESGQDLIKEIDQILLPMTDEEMGLLRGRLKESQSSATATLGTLITVTLLVAGLLVALAVMMRQNLGQRAGRRKPCGAVRRSSAPPSIARAWPRPRPTPPRGTSCASTASSASSPATARRSCNAGLFSTSRTPTIAIHPRWPFIAWSAARRPNIP